MNKRYLTLGWVSGEENYYSDGMVRAYVNSANCLGENVDRVLLTQMMPAGVQAELEAGGFQVIRCPPRATANFTIARHRDYWAYLAAHGHRFAWVYLSDVRDVVFQKDPFPYLEAHYGGREHVLLFSELCRHDQVNAKGIAWNVCDQLKLQGALKDPAPGEFYAAWEVVNGGLLAGTPEALRQLILLLDQIGSLVQETSCTDQAVLNYLYHTRLKRDPLFQLVRSDSSPLTFMRHEAAGSCPTPRLTSDRLLQHPGLEVPYHVVHQWDRLPTAEAILAKYAFGIIRK